LARRAEVRAGRRAALGAAFVLAVFAAAGLRSAAAADTAGRTHEVVIQGLQYVPETITVRRGDVVVWTNKDPFPHTVTAPGAFDSKSILGRRLVALHGAARRQLSVRLHAALEHEGHAAGRMKPRATMGA
jgi:Plastocyanin